MVFTLALRNFIHDRISLLVTLVGIVFSVLLMAIQLGLFLGTQKVITGLIDHSDADLWITPAGARSIDDSPLLQGGERFVALSTPGVAEAHDLAIFRVPWQKADGSQQAVVIVGSEFEQNSLKAWNVISGDLRDLKRPGGVTAERTYLAKLGVTKVGDTALIFGREVQVVAITDRIRSFTTLPYVFTTLEHGRRLIGARSDQSGFVMIRTRPGADVEQVKKVLQGALRNADVVTTEEFRTRSINHWFFGTGAGVALIAGTILGLIVGIVVVAQTLYASTKDHLNEFATLRALGASSSYIHRVILFQAIFSAVIGFTLGIAMSFLLVWATWDTNLNILLDLRVAGILFVATVAMCVFSALSAIIKVTRIDPAMVFTR